MLRKRIGITLVLASSAIAVSLLLSGDLALIEIDRKNGFFTISNLNPLLIIPIGCLILIGISCLVFPANWKSVWFKFPRLLKALCLVLIVLITWASLKLSYRASSRIYARGFLEQVEPQPAHGEPGPKKDAMENWRVEVDIPDDRVQQVRAACEVKGELDVDMICIASATQVFRGKLGHNGFPLMNQVGNNKGMKDKEAQFPVRVRLHPIKGDIPEAFRLPKKLLMKQEVSARVYCE